MFRVLLENGEEPPDFVRLIPARAKFDKTPPTVVIQAPAPFSLFPVAPLLHQEGTGEKQRGKNVGQLVFERLIRRSPNTCG